MKEEKEIEKEKKFEKLEVFTNTQIIEILFNKMPDCFISKIDKDIFYLHFLSNNPNLQAINQIGNRYDFICLFDELTKYMNKKVRITKNANDRCDKWLSEHCTFEGKRLSAKDISSARAKKKGEHPNSLLTINKIIQEVIKSAQG